MASTKPPSLGLIYLRSAFGAVTKKHTLPSSVTTLPSNLPQETLQFAVDRQHVGQFLNCMGSSKPEDSKNRLPFAYLQCYLASLPMNILSSGAFPLNIVGMVHETIRIQSHQYVLLDQSDNLKATCAFEPNIGRSEKGDWVFTAVTNVEQNSNPVMTITNSYLVLNPKRNTIKIDKPVVARPDYDKDWTAIADWNLPTSTGADFAKVNGDINPIHMNKLSASLFGYKSHIAHGMYSVCKLAGEIEKNWPQLEDTSSFDLQARFSRPVFLPNPSVKLYWKEQSSGSQFDFCTGTSHGQKENQFKETVEGSFSIQ